MDENTEGVLSYPNTDFGKEKADVEEFGGLHYPVQTYDETEKLSDLTPKLSDSELRAKLENCIEKNDIRGFGNLVKLTAFRAGAGGVDLVDNQDMFRDLLPDDDTSQKVMRDYIEQAVKMNSKTI